MKNIQKNFRKHNQTIIITKGATTTLLVKHSKLYILVYKHNTNQRLKKNITQAGHMDFTFRLESNTSSF
jgi:hypothetical protein